MPNRHHRVHRLLKIISLIQTQAGWTAQRLASECGTSTRTLYRDLNALESAGVPYLHDGTASGYHMRSDFFMPPVNLTLEEALALVALGEQVGGQEQIPLLRAGAKAVTKIRSVLPVSVRDQIGQIEQHLSIHLAQAGPHDGFADVYELVRAAIARRRALRCGYESVKGGHGSRQSRDFLFKPYALLFSQRAWYTIGFHAGHRELRCLKLNRFTSCQLTTVTYDIPRGFRLSEYFGNAWRMIRGHKTYRVQLHFDAEVAENVTDTHWHPTQDIEWCEDGSITFRCTVDGLDEIVWWVLGYGPHCTVRKPKALAERVRKLVTATASRYSAPSRLTRSRRGDIRGVTPLG